MIKVTAKTYNILRNVKVWQIFVAALVIRIGFIIILYTPDYYKSLSDDLAYMNLALEIIKQGFFITDLEQLGLYSSVVGPGIGWLLLPVVIIFGENWLAVFIYTAIISSLIPVFVYKLTNVITEHKMIAVFAAFWAILYFLHLKYTLTAGKDIWMSLLLLVIVYLNVKFYRHQKWSNIIITSILFTLLIHLDERFLILSPIILGYFVIIEHKNFQSYNRPIVFIVLTIILSFPWILRNYYVYEKPILISVRTAPFTDKLFGYESIEYFPSHEGRWYLSPEQIDSIQNGYMSNSIKKQMGSSWEQQVHAIQLGVIPHKFTYKEKIIANFINYWQPCDFSYGYYQTGYRFDGKWSIKHNIVALLNYGIILLFSLFGVVFLFRRKPIITSYIILIIITYFFLHFFLIHFTTYRYRAPIDSFLIIFGNTGLYHTIRFIFKAKE